MVIVSLGFLHLIFHKYLLNAYSVLAARKAKHTISKEYVCTLYPQMVFLTKYFSTRGQS